MNLRCGFCQTPYALGRTEILAALQHLESENLTHYDAHCPRCRRATPILRQKLEMAIPNWKEELKEAVNEPAPEPVRAAEQPKKTGGMKPAAKKEAAKPAGKKSSPSRPGSKTPVKKGGR
jgi:hypothetical protein